MKRQSDNSNSADGGITDEQLDMLLHSTPLPEVTRAQERQMRRDVNRMLRSSRPSLFRRSAVQVAMCAAMCCILIMVAIKFRVPESTPGLLKNSAVAKKHNIEPVAPIAPRQIITRVSLKKRRAHSVVQQRLNSISRETQILLNSFSDSKLGLSVLEHTFNELESARRSTIQGTQLSESQLLELAQLQNEWERSWIMSIQSPDTSIADKTMAFKKLCRCGSVHALPFALNYWDSQDLQPDIALFAKRHANSETIGKMISSTNQHLATDLMIELLRRNDPTSVAVFLETTHRNKLYSIAQIAGHDSNEAPTLLLIRALKSNRIGLVQAASMTLSKIDNPQITSHLFELAQQPRYRNAAALALTARQDSEASRFVNLAINDIHWSATIVTAQKKRNRLLAAN